MYSFTSRVRFSEINEQRVLSIPSIINYLQDCSTFHSESVGRGMAHVDEVGLAWLLAGWELLIDRLPRFDEEIRISTWATGFNRLFAKRNFTICTADDARAEHPLVRADSLWFLFDRQTGRPIRPPQKEIEPFLPDLADDKPLDMPPMQRHLRVHGTGTPAAPVVVTGAHIDTNHHVNNAQYVSIALGVLPKRAVFDARRIDVQYSVAAKLGDTIYPHVHADVADAADTTGTIVTLDAQDGTTYAAVRVQ